MFVSVVHSPRHYLRFLGLNTCTLYNTRLTSQVNRLYSVLQYTKALCFAQVSGLNKNYTLIKSNFTPCFKCLHIHKLKAILLHNVFLFNQGPRVLHQNLNVRTNTNIRIG